MSLKMETVPDGQKKILLALSLVVVLVLIHLFVVEPMKEKAASSLSQASALNEETDRRIMMVKKIIPMKEEIASLKLAILPMTNKFILRKELGSYPIQRKIYEVAPSELKVVRFTERGRVRLVDPVLSKVQASAARGRSKASALPPIPFYDRYQAEVAFQGGYRTLLEFLRTLEDGNPFFSIVSMEVRGNNSTPEAHDILMTIEWPVDAPPPPPPKVKK